MKSANRLALCGFDFDLFQGTVTVSGLATTFDVLTKTPNEASVDVLVKGLNASREECRDGALRAIFDRRSVVGQKAVLKRLDTISEEWREIIDRRRGRMSQALRDGLLGTDHQVCKNACQAILWFQEYDLVPTLVNLLSDDKSWQSELAGQTLLALCGELYEELASPRDYRNRRDPQMVRRAVVSTLDAAVKQYPVHKSRELLEAFLVLIPRDNSTLKQILMDPRGRCYGPLLEVMKTSEHSGVIRLVLSFLDDRYAPSAALGVVSQRTDAKFVHHLVERYGEMSPVVKSNLKDMDTLKWLENKESLLEGMSEAEQHGAMKVVMATSVRQSEKFAVVELLLRKGNPGGRRAAAEALAEFNGPEANELSQKALRDEDPTVRSHAIAQLRSRRIPGALPTVIDALDSAETVERDAARESLSEFNFARFSAALDTLDDAARKSTGLLVKKVDPETVPGVRAELESPIRTRRLRGLELLEVMELVDELESDVSKLLRDDEDHVVRAEAARVLAASMSPTVLADLSEAVFDRATAVQEAAKASLAMIEERRRGMLEEPKS